VTCVTRSNQDRHPFAGCRPPPRRRSVPSLFSGALACTSRMQTTCKCKHCANASILQASHKHKHNSHTTVTMYNHHTNTMQLHFHITLTSSTPPPLPPPQLMACALSQKLSTLPVRHPTFPTNSTPLALNPTRIKPRAQPPGQALESRATACFLMRLLGILGFIIMFVVPGALYYKSR